MSKSYTFPKDFLWGSATAAYQVEGAAGDDGRGPSVWDTFSKAPGNVYNGQTGDVSADQYHRYLDDIQLMKHLGLKAYRFSIGWPRVQPDGEGALNEKGLDYYDRLVDALLEAGIQPWPTLFHWDLPQPLQDKYKGWQSRKCAEAFGRYAGIMVERLSDRVKNWMTINEMSSFCLGGHRDGHHAPGQKLDAKTVNQVCHHALLGHGYAVRAMREKARQPIRIAQAENLTSTVPAIENDECIEAARKAFRVANARFATPIWEGRYIDEYLEQQGADAPEVQPGDMESIGQPLDVMTVNGYCPANIVPAENKLGYRVLPVPRTYPTYVPKWLRFGPSIAYWLPRLAKEVWNIDNVYITENGCACDDMMDHDGNVYDTDRVLYLRQHFIAMARAVAEGWPLKGYFLWSFIDNFEWAEGYSQRFGITYCNFETLERTPKLSAKWYGEVIKHGRVV